MAEPTAPEQNGDLSAVLRLWDRLSTLLGTATTAALLRRALAQLAPLGPALAAVRVQRAGPTFTCSVENAPAGDPTHELRALGHSLAAILRELTGPVVLQYLATDPELAVFGFAEASQ